MKILIADDDLTCRKQLELVFSKWGYAFVSACDGKEAWKILQQDGGPRLAILDWMMPGFDGVELCRKIKKNKNDSYTYTVLLTSKSEKEDIVTALEAGADDFVSKPFDLNELKSRLEVGFRILRYEAKLVEKNLQLSNYATQMEALAEERAKQLLHSERMAMLGVMSAGIAHEIKNPLTFVSGNIQIIQKVWEEIEKPAREGLKKDAENQKNLMFLLDEMPGTLEGVRNGVTRINRIVNSLGAYSRKDEEKRSNCYLNNCIEQSLELCNNVLKYKGTVEKKLDGKLPAIQAVPQQLE